MGLAFYTVECHWHHQTANCNGSETITYAYCNSGDLVTGGGGSIDTDNTYIRLNYYFSAPYGENGWVTTARIDDPNAYPRPKAFVRCVTITQ
jgi:hypothetical protein